VADMLQDQSAGRVWPPVFAARRIPALAEPFQNEPHVDFSREDEIRKVEGAIKKLQAQEIDDVIVPAKQMLSSKNPSSGKILGSVAVTHPAQVQHIVAQAKKTGENWSKTPVGDRAAVLHRAAALMREQKADLTALLMLETGKPL